MGILAVVGGQDVIIRKSDGLSIVIIALQPTLLSNVSDAQIIIVVAQFGKEAVEWPM